MILARSFKAGTVGANGDGVLGVGHVDVGLLDTRKVSLDGQIGGIFNRVNGEAFKPESSKTR